MLHRSYCSPKKALFNEDLCRKAERMHSVLSLCLFCFFARAEQPVLPTFEDKKTPLKLLGAVRKDFPQVFNENQNSGLDILELMQTQDALLKELRGNGEYLRLSAERPSYLTLNFETGGEVPAERQVDSSRFTKWKRHAQEVASQLPKNIPVSEAIEKYLSEAEEAGGRAQGYLTGLITTLPKERRGEVFKMPFPEKVKALANELPLDLKAAGFRAELYGITSPSFSREEALLQLGARWQANTIAKDLSTLSLIAAHGDPGATAAQFEENLKKLRPDSVKALLDHEQASSFWSPEGRSLQLANQVEKELKDLFEKNPSKESSSPKKSIRLEEAPAYAAIFRGCAGGDCSSTHNAYYPWSPAERIYYVFDEMGDLKGYVAGTVLDNSRKSAAEKRSLYIHTIAGRRISAEDTKLIVDGLYEARDRIGVKGLLFPTRSKRNSNINYAEINGQLEKILPADNKAVPISYIDSSTREVISKSEYTGMNYDEEKNNRTALEYSPGVSMDSRKVRTEIVETKLPLVELKDVDEAELLLAALDLSRSDKKDVASKILESIKGGKQKLNEIERAINNPEKRSLKGFYSKVISTFKKHGITPSKDYLERRRHFFDAGMLSASDAFSPANREATMRGVVRMLSDENVDHNRVFELIERSPRAFRESDVFQRYLEREIFTPDDDNERNSDAIRAAIEHGALRDFYSKLALWLGSSDSNITENVKELLQNEVHHIDASELRKVLQSSVPMSREARYRLWEMFDSHEDDTAARFLKKQASLLAKSNVPEEVIIASENLAAAREFWSGYGYDNSIEDKDVRAALIEKMSSSHPDVRRAALNLFKELGADASTMPTVLEFLKSGDPALRAVGYAAITAARARPNPVGRSFPDERATLERGLADPSDEVKEAVLEALTKIQGRPWIGPYLERHLKSSNEKLRLEAIRLLTSSGHALGKQTLDTLINLVKKGPSSESARIMDGLAKNHQSPALKEIFAELIDAENPPLVRQKAALFLEAHAKSLSKKVMERLVKALQIPHPEVQENILRALAKNSLTPIRGELLKMMQKGNLGIRQLAAKALSNDLENRTVNEEFQRLLDHESPVLREQAVKAYLNKDDLVSRSHLDKLITLLSDTDAAVAFSAAETLTTLKVDGEKRLAEIARRSKDSRLVMRALEALAKSKKNQSGLFFDLLMEHQDKDVLAQAGRFLLAKGNVTKKMEEAIFSRLKELSPGERLPLLQAVAKSGDQRLHELLWEEFQSSTFVGEVIDLFTESAKSLKTSPPPERQAALLEILNGQDVAKAAGAARLLKVWKYNDPKIVAHALSLLESTEADKISRGVTLIEGATELGSEAQRRIVQAYGKNGEYPQDYIEMLERKMKVMPEATAAIIERIMTNKDRRPIFEYQTLSGLGKMTPELDRIFAHGLSENVDNTTNSNVYNVLSGYRKLGPLTGAALLRKLGHGIFYRSTQNLLKKWTVEPGPLLHRALVDVLRNPLGRREAVLKMAAKWNIRNPRVHLAIADLLKDPVMGDMAYKALEYLRPDEDIVKERLAELSKLKSSGKRSKDLLLSLGNSRKKQKISDLTCLMNLGTAGQE
jgi:hypothetical protein